MSLRSVFGGIGMQKCNGEKYGEIVMFLKMPVEDSQFESLYFAFARKKKMVNS